MSEAAAGALPRVHDELDVLKARLLEMGGFAEERVRASVQALVTRDAALAEAVRVGDGPINRFHLTIDQACVTFLALNQPMAADLRAIVAAVRVSSDLERVGDLAVNIAEAVQRYILHLPVKPLIDIPKMAEIAQRMLRDALDAYVRRDMAMAEQVLADDDALDRLKSQVFVELLAHMRAAPETIEPALDLLLVSRHLERVGDHATNIAEAVIFMVGARDVRHRRQGAQHGE